MTDQVVNDDRYDENGVLTIGINRGTQSTSSARSDKPGNRIYNPLSQFASYTYLLGLYMVTPSAYDAFVASGKTQINSLVDADGKPVGGTYLVAQSGGINRDINIRASTDELDYYIDNLSIKTYLTGKATLTASTSTEIKFQIVEPYGFSFLSDLKRVADIIYGSSSNIARPKNPTKQFFVLGVKFLGYDENGKPISTQNPDPSITPDQDLYRIQDRYFDILITNIKFKITGASVVYDVSAVALSTQTAFGITKGMIKTTISAEGKDVQEAINTIIAKMNADQERVEKEAQIRLNRYSVEWVGPEELVRSIKEASIKSPIEAENFANKASTGMNDATNTESVTGNQENKVPDLNKKVVQIKNDTPVMQAISQVISQSTYLTNALDKVYASDTQPNTDTGDFVDKPNETKQNISWYSLGAEVRNAVWEPKISDYVYDIVYIIQPYETPAVRIPYGRSRDTYYGPYKRYDYWYTGQNSEVLSYEQSIDNAYFTVFLTETGDSEENPEITQVPYSLNNQSRLDSLTVGREAQNALLTNLYDPGSFAKAQITILGDPDFLMIDSPSSQRTLYDKYYAPDGFTINPYAAQTFIEIDFKEAKDIDLETGTLKINDKILFWKYGEETQGQENIKGISYMVIDVLSTFQGGAFKQKLNCVINPLSLATRSSRNSREDTDTNNAANSIGLTGLQELGTLSTPETTEALPVSTRNQNTTNDD